MPLPYTSIPVAHAPADVRLGYLRKVLGLTFVGLVLAGGAGVATAVALAMTGGALLSGYVPMIVILGCWAVSNYVARPMVFGSAKVAGFVLGSVAQGVAMGFLLLVAFLLSASALGNPFTLIGLALGLAGFSGLGMAAYVWTARKDFSIIGAGLAALSIPMLVLMAVSFAFPSFIGGTAGIVVSGLFVVVSAGGLLYQLNQVIHDYDTDMHIEGAYTITLGLLVLFWNILTLLMRLTRR